MTGRGSAGVSLVDDAGWGAILSKVLADMSVGVIACDAERRVLAATAPARDLLRAFGSGAEPRAPLPASIARALELHLERRSGQLGSKTPPVRAETPDGKLAVYVSGLETDDTSAVHVIVWVHREVVRETDLLATLRESYPGLSARDFQLISLLRRGHSNRQIAHALGLRESTVSSYLRDLFEQFGIGRRGELIALVEALRTKPT